MDRVYKIRRASREMASTYIPGDCHICQQSNVRVRRLKCGVHNFCRMCYEFEPRLAREDFSCTICMEKIKSRVTDSVDVDSFFTRHTGVYNKKTDTTISVDGNKLLNFGSTEDDNDLDGYNTEWDYLLQSVIGTPQAGPKRDKSPVQGISLPQPTFNCIQKSKTLPKKSSYIHLVLRSANMDNTAFLNDATPQPTANTVTTHVEKEIESKPTSGSSINCASLISKFGSWIITKPTNSLAEFLSDPKEIERGTSPCKGIRLQESYAWSDETFSIDPSYSETEQMLEQIGTIEGPSFTSSSCSSSASGSDGTGSDFSGINLGDEGFWD